MTGKTHRDGGMLVSIVGFAMLKHYGLLLPDVNPMLQWAVMYPFCMFGSTAPDLDHHWESCPSHDYPSKVINSALHATNGLHEAIGKKLSDREKGLSLSYKLSGILAAKHRSWQTHSDMLLMLFIYILHLVWSGGVQGISLLDQSILMLIITGLSMGILAHYILDILTPEGIHSLVLIVTNMVLLRLGRKKPINTKFHLVPKKEFFKTGGQWEQAVQKVLRWGTYIALVWLVFTLVKPYVGNLLPFTLEFDYGG